MSTVKGLILVEVGSWVCAGFQEGPGFCNHAMEPTWFHLFHVFVEKILLSTRACGGLWGNFRDGSAMSFAHK